MHTIHTFDSTDEAYDHSQCDDNIKHGDILLVPSEGVAGWLNMAWPTAATSHVGVFHALLPEYRDEFADQIAAALAALAAATAGNSYRLTITAEPGFNVPAVESDFDTYDAAYGELYATATAAGETLNPHGAGWFYLVTEGRRRATASIELR